MDAPKYYLRTLGELSLESAGQPVPGLATQRKRLALLALLAASGGRGVARDKILAYFWPESDGERARNTSYQFIHVLKRELGDVIVPGNGDLKLNRELIGSDLSDFRESIARREFLRAVELYRGPFLDGVYLRDAGEFERWLDGERSDLAASYATALEQLAAEAKARGDHQACVQWWRTRANLDPLSARVTRAYIDALVAAGDRGAALKHAQVHFAVVRSELGAEPEPDLETHVAQLRRPRPAQPAREEEPDASTNAPPQAATNALPLDSAVGQPRASLWRRASWPTVAILGAALVTAIAITMRSMASKPIDNSKVLVAPFINHSGDRDLDAISAMAADWTTQALAESELVDVVDGPTAFQISRIETDRAASDIERVRLLVQRTQARIVVWGTLYLVGDTIVLQAKISDARDGSVIRTVPPIKALKADPMPAIEQLRDRTVGALALLVEPRLASLSARSSKPPLIEAYRDYLQGLDALQRNQQREAVGLFLRAAQVDTTFGLPLIWAYLAERNFFDPTLPPTARADSIVNVLELRQTQLAPLDRYALEYLKLVRKAAPREERLIVLRRITALAPQSNWSFLEAVLLFGSGRGEEARTALHRIDPEQGWVPSWRDYWSLEASLQHYLGDYRAELEAAGNAARVNPASSVNPRVRALIGLGRVDSARAVIENVTATVLPARKAGFMALAARELRAHGYHAQADSMFEQVVAWYRSPEASANVRNRLYHAQVALEAGRLEESRQLAMQVLDDSARFARPWEKNSARGVLGTALARLGDRRAAEAQLRMLDLLKTAAPHNQGGAVAAQARIAGALRNCELAVKYLAEMQANPNIIEPAGKHTHSDQSLRCLDGDPAIRRLR